MLCFEYNANHGVSQIIQRIHGCVEYKKENNNRSCYMELKDKMTIIQEFVPGKQVTLCHIIANPGEVLYTKLGLDPQTDYSKSAIGVLTVIPYESAVIAADIAMKASGAEIGFVDRFTGTLIISGSYSAVEAAFTAVREYFVNKLHYECCELTKT